MCWIKSIYNIFEREWPPVCVKKTRALVIYRLGLTHYALDKCETHEIGCTIAHKTLSQFLGKWNEGGDSTASSSTSQLTARP